MAIDAKELMQAPRFEGYGSFVAARPANGDWKASYLFECFGGQVNVEVEESETITVPPAGATFFIAGHVRYSPRNGTISLVADEKKFVAEVSAEQYINGMTIKGVGIVEAKESSTMNRQTFLSATIKWFGGLHKFRKLTPEVFQRIPNRGGAVRFGLGLLVQSERNQAGQNVQMQVPSLVFVQQEELKSGSMPGVSPATAAPVPPKPITPAKV